jgi:hypothetical protein
VTLGTPGRGYDVKATESLCPTAFIATTVKVVATVFLRPVTVNVLMVGPTLFANLLSGTQMTLYPVMAEPPSEIGALQLIVAEATPATPVTPRTAVGGPATGGVGIIGLDTEEGAEVPAEFMATTVNVRVVPLAKPVSVVVRTLSTFTAEPVDGVTV